MALVVIGSGLVYALYHRAPEPPAGAANAAGVPAPSCAVANIRRVSVNRGAAVREIAKTPAYTQGLIFTDGQLYESTGWRGRSAIYRLDDNGGQRRELARLDDHLFGEGLARIDDRLYQLTWRAGLAFAYAFDPDDRALVRISTFSHDGEGWGLTNLGGELVLSDGSDVLSFIDPATFEGARALPVRLGAEPIRQLNELEIVDGEILANIYGQPVVVGIDPRTGCVTTVIDATDLVNDVGSDLRAVAEPICSATCSPLDFVLNGIAYNPGRGELYLTGKNWPHVFVFRDILG